MGNFPGIFKSRMKRINSSYKLIEFLSGRRSVSVNTSSARRSSVSELGSLTARKSKKMFDG